MFDYIEKLRKKPEAEKRKAALLISICVTLVIALIWGGMFAMRISSEGFSNAAGSSSGDAPSLGQSFSNFTDQVKGIIKNASDLTSTSSAAGSTAAEDLFANDATDTASESGTGQ